MPVTPKAIAHLTILYQKYKSNIPKTFSAPKNPNSRIQSQLYYITMQRSYLKKIIGRIRRRGSRIKSENTMRSGKSRLWLLISTLPIFRRKRKRGVTLVKLCVLTMIRKTNLPAIVSSQKASVGLGNLCAGD